MDIKLLLVVLGMAVLAGCAPTILETGNRDNAVLVTAEDTIVLPNQQVVLRARLQQGDLLDDMEGIFVRFENKGLPILVAQTDDEGWATAYLPSLDPGDYDFTVQTHPIGLPKMPPSQTLRVVCRGEQTPICVVDLDKTVVESGFEAVLLGDPEPAPYSQLVLHQLAQDYTLVYLTHRPDYFGPKSKAWLWQHGYPRGPVLMSTARTFIKGSRSYKTQRLAMLRKQFPNLAVGIGDKISDALAYHDIGMTSIVIVRPPDASRPEARSVLIAELSKLPEDVQVVTNWQEIQAVADPDGKADFPPSRIIEQLKSEAGQR